MNLPSVYKNYFVEVIDNVLTKEECDVLINKIEEKGLEDALINDGGYQRYVPYVRNSKRCIIDDKEIANMIYSRIVNKLPKVFNNKKLSGINERLRFLKYNEGEYFKGHFDGTYTTPDNLQISQITLQLYLNEGFEGGETTFINPNNEDEIQKYIPKTGSVLLFQHDMYHEGSVLQKGIKYAMRTDIMFFNELDEIFFKKKEF